MAMAFFREDPNTSFELPGFVSPRTKPADASAAGPIPLIKAKLQIPDTHGALPRRWLTGVLEKSAHNAAATMIVGRAGTGKTTLAAEFIQGRPDVSWYAIDAVDCDWSTFQTYFRMAIFREGRKCDRAAKLPVPACDTPLDLFADLTAGLELRSKRWPSLLVLDSIHHLFDRPWFHELFELLIASTPVDSHTLMLSRSKPPTPIWRMRSKQVLNVIDEKLLAFSASEVSELFMRHGVDGIDVDAVLAASFGHASALHEIVNARSTLSV
jgi:ATP/maltotriose-dependent transcriptional regulator MalT